MRVSLGPMATWEAGPIGGWQLVTLGTLPVVLAPLGSEALVDPRPMATSATSPGATDAVLAATKSDRSADVVVRGRTFGDELVLETWLEVRSLRPDAVVDGAPSSFRARFAVPPGAGRIRWWESGWGVEWEPAEASLDESVRLVSLAGRSSARRHPFALIDLGGPVLGVAVAWSGNWEIAIERTGFDEVELRVGLADPGFRHELMEDEIFRTPPVVLAIAPDGDPEFDRRRTHACGPGALVPAPSGRRGDAGRVEPLVAVRRRCHR